MAGQIIKRGDRTWLVRVFVGRDEHGKRRYRNETIHGTKKDAEQIARELLTRRDKGQLFTQPKSTVNEYLDTWLKTTVAPSVRARTLHDYTYTLKQYVRPYLGKALVTSVTPVEMRAMLAALRVKDLSPRTIRKAHEVTRNAFEQAVADRVITENPARGRLVVKALPKKETKERETITRERLNAFLDAAAKERLHAYWQLLLFGGLRPEEANALRWSDLKDNTVSITRVLVDKPGMPLSFDVPKTKKSRRAVVLPQRVVDVLREHKRQQAAEQLRAGEAWQGSGLVFCNEVGQPMRQRQAGRKFRALLKVAKLPHMRVYDLRHSAATLLLEAGEDLKVVSERLGHSTLALTADVYAHVTKGMQERAAARLDALTGTG